MPLIQGHSHRLNTFDQQILATWIAKTVMVAELRKPALDLSDVVRQQCTLITGALQWTVAGFARSRRAVKPNAAWRRAEGAGYALSS